MVILDDPLTALLGFPQNKVGKKEAFLSFLGALTPYHAISGPGSAPVVSAGDPPRVGVTIKRRHV